MDPSATASPCVVVRYCVAAATSAEEEFDDFAMRWVEREFELHSNAGAEFAELDVAAIGPLLLR